MKIRLWLKRFFSRREQVVRSGRFWNGKTWRCLTEEEMDNLQAFGDRVGKQMQDACDEMGKLFDALNGKKRV